jgi:hypothetical protein
MIDEKKTFKEFGYTSNKLSYGSDKYIIAICNICKKERVLKYNDYRDLCRNCAHTNRGPFNIEYFYKVKNSIHNTNIDELSTFDKFGYYSIDLSVASSKYICVKCSICESERNIQYLQYSMTHGRCIKCSNISKGKRQRLSKARMGEKHPMYGRYHTDESKKKLSATLQGILYEEWESFAIDQPYCPLFNESCKESNREKYNRECFVCGISESENITSTGKYRKLSVHHVDMNKDQGCDGHEWKLIPVCMHCHGKLHTKRMQSCIEYILKEE